MAEDCARYKVNDAIRKGGCVRAHRVHIVYLYTIERTDRASAAAPIRAEAVSLD